MNRPADAVRSPSGLAGPVTAYTRRVCAEQACNRPTHSRPGRGRILARFCLGLAAAAFLSLAFPLPSRAVDYTVATVPNVHLADRNNYVSNPDGIINAADQSEINRLAAGLQRTLGVELAVVAVKSIGDNEAREFATDLFQHWGIGQRGKDSGLLIQLVTDPPQRSIVFETGYGLEGILPDAIAYRLQQRYMVPDLRNGDFSAGMLKGVQAVSDYLMANDTERASMLEPEQATAGAEDSPFMTVGGILLLLILFFVFRKNPAALAFILGALLGRGGRGGPGGTGGGGSWGGGGSMSRF